MKFEINRTKIEGGCQSGRKVVTHNFKSDLSLLVTTLLLATPGSASGRRDRDPLAPPSPKKCAHADDLVDDVRSGRRL